ncbi:MAG: IGHMBP2 family helicase, partial [Aquificae bacterium]|nr:IGHMBP2 family helicase [Aquificota bacterium]
SSYEEYKKHFLRLIELERKAQTMMHLREIRNLSGEERQRRGRALLNLRAKSMGRGLGGVYLVRYARPGGLPRTEISVGDVVLVSSGKPTGREVQGTVAEKTSSYLVVAFNEKPPPYALGKRVRIDLFSNEVTFKRMEEALRKLKEHPLLEFILGKG